MRPFSMSYISGEDRGPVDLLPAAIEDYVAADARQLVADGLRVSLKTAFVKRDRQ